jgi:hypothetical protein
VGHLGELALIASSSSWYWSRMGLLIVDAAPPFTGR